MYSVLFIQCLRACQNSEVAARVFFARKVACLLYVLCSLSNRAPHTDQEASRAQLGPLSYYPCIWNLSVICFFGQSPRFT